MFYKSFAYAAKAFPDEYRLEFYDYLFDCCFFDLPIDEVPFPYRPVIIQMFASVSSARDRHEKAIEDGAKGGRPSKQEYIPPEEWQAYRKDHSQEETAEHFGIAVRTLRNWERKTSGEAKTGKNLNVNENDNDNDNANDNVNVIISNNNINKGANGALTNRPVLPQLKPGEEWTSEPMRQRNSGLWVAFYKTASGEERCMALGEQGV